MKYPILRFKEFKGDWKQKNFGSLVKRSKEKYNPRESEVAFPCIELESIEKGTSILLEIFNSKDQSSIKTKFNKGDILFGKLRPSLRKYLLAPFEGVCSSEIWVFQGKGILNQFLFYLIQTSKFYDASTVSSGSKMPRSDWNYVKDVSFSIPSLPEQQKIADFLSAVDKKIELITRKKELLEQYKKGVMQKLFSREIRFKDEQGREYPEWEKRKFREILFEHREKSSGEEEVFSVSVHKGLVNQIEHLGRSFAAQNTDHYNLVKPNDIVYTKSPTGDFPLGIIKQSKVAQSVIVSPLYGVFTPETRWLGYILDAYFESSINTHNYLHSIIQKGAKNTINITNSTFLSKSLVLPIDKNEQKKIAEFLMAIDKSIELVQVSVELVQQFKKGLLQQMFV